MYIYIPLPTEQFSEIEFSAYNVPSGWFTGIELVLDPITWVHFLLVPLDSFV